ncbi:MAG: GuaB3 family IMP dehydrogenase-related protein [Acidimicrobiaceae bacterium]|nr:GuaB3 family IMP dehydrogenase-related protein [Acidimicrobiaceae bacterium]MYI53085.1 GuaB3 family IMP dehydrogenase-related protein [Acidimicrobiaceae bacterium]
MAEVEIGLGKSGRRAYRLDEVAIIPSRRTRDLEDVDISWQIDAYRFDIPVLGASTDSVTSPATAVRMGELGGVGILDLEGVWTRCEDPATDLAELSTAPLDAATARLRELYSRPVQPELVAARIAEIAGAGVRTAGRVRPQRAEKLAPHAIAADINLLVISGTIVSAEHVSSAGDPLNLKTFIRRMQTPVIVGGCVSYQAALHLMRTGAAGVLVGAGAGHVGTTRHVLGLDAPQATAIADARAARMRHLDETGVYCHVIADGTMSTAGDIAKAIVCGADAAMVGLPLASASDSPCPGRHWDLSSGHPTLPRGRIMDVEPRGTLVEVLHGPALGPGGTTNLMGGLRTSMAKCGYTDVKDFQRAAVAIVSP